MKSGVSTAVHSAKHCRTSSSNRLRASPAKEGGIVPDVLAYKTLHIDGVEAWLHEDLKNLPGLTAGATWKCLYAFEQYTFFKTKNLQLGPQVYRMRHIGYYYCYYWEKTRYRIRNTFLKGKVHVQVLIYNGCLAIIAQACCLCNVMANLWYNWLVTHDFAWPVRPEILSARVAKTGLLSNPHPPNVSTAMGMNRMF